jgi:hypothetical protein
VPAEQPTFEELLRGSQTSALHLEMRDGYSLTDPAFVAWQAGEAIDAGAYWPQWFELIPPVVARGVVVRRGRIISEPISEYIRYEHAITTALNIAAGEEVRWLPRRQSSDLALPGNDFWLFDERIVMLNHFSGNGESVAHEITDNPALIKLCASAFLAVWERAIPHRDYQPA